MTIDRALAASGCLAALMLAGCGSREEPYHPDVCHGGKLTLEERSAAMQEGYQIHPNYGCIYRESWDEMQAMNARSAALAAQRKAEREQAERLKQSLASAPSALAEARGGFQTVLGAPASGLPLPDPPADLFSRSDYESPGVGKLPAWVTPDPRDGQKHPAIVWITGGDSNSLDDFWTEGGPDNDQSASAFRKAGMIMMFPTLRGGNTNASRKEFFYGEVGDVIAAGAHLASLPYVDRVFLGGHSTGGTLALLVAESTDRFEAVFVFGAVSDVASYGSNFLPFDLAAADRRERQMRAPVQWLEGIVRPTYLFEGEEAPGNLDDLEVLCAATRNPRVLCVPVPGKNHFSVLDAVAKKLAARIVVGHPDGAPLAKPADFAR